MKVVIAGDYCEHARVSPLIENRLFGALFDKIAPVVKDSDYSFVNFEFPIVNNNCSPIEKYGPHLKGSAVSVDAIKYAGFNVCTLANNHILDQGENCCLKTKKLLEEAGIKTVGVGDSISSADDILYLEKSGEKLAVINCCEHEFSVATSISAGANPVNPISQYYIIQEARKNADFVLVVVHGGHEMCQFPSPRMKELYHFYIDVGADAVVNHHQHCYSGYEKYNEKLIVYGLGNFLFDWAGRQNQRWNEGYLVSIDFSNKGIDFMLHPYVQCNETVGVLPLNEEKQQDFWNQIDKINVVIKDGLLLKQRYEEWIMKHKGPHLTIFQPYLFRITKILFNKGLLPSFITKSKRLQILNYINCESHLDKLRIILSNIK